MAFFSRRHRDDDDRPPIPFPQRFRLTGEVRHPEPGEWFYQNGAPFACWPESWGRHLWMVPILEVTDEAWLREHGPAFADEVQRRTLAGAN